MIEGIKEFMYFIPFLMEIIKRDFKKKYYKSILGVAWSMLNPLLMMIVITIVFSTLFKREIEFYPIYWLSGNLIFMFIMDGTNSSLNSVIMNAGMITKMKIPKYFFCISTVTQHFITLLLSLIPYYLVAMVIGVGMSWHSLLIILPLIQTYFFTLGAGMILCAYGTMLRDLNYLYGVLRRLLMYVTPIFYPISILPESVRFVFELNPIYVYICLFRDLTMNHTMPTERMLIYGTVYAVLTFVLGMVTFKEKEDRFFLYI